jgi:cob(I)alamin adenosyltransferase
MSIATRKGDTGTTGLMFNRRVSKCHPRVDGYGTVDELNAALGSVRALTQAEFVQSNILRIQQDLVILMGELATLPEDLPRYVEQGYKKTTPDFTDKLDELVKTLESQNISFKGWATPGANPLSAALDVARTVSRRAERKVCSIHEDGQLDNADIIVYLNRLSDVLWLMARWAESEENFKES